jgi:hypothetical protein
MATPLPCPRRLDPDTPDARDPPRDPDCPLIWNFTTMDQVERWAAASEKGDDGDD